MAIKVADTKETFQGDGSTVVFSFNFKVDSAADLLVFLTSVTGAETLLTLGVDYTVTLSTQQNATPGGTVTLVVAPGVGVPLVVMRGVDFVRTTEFTTSVPPNIIEQELDRLTMYAQQLGEKLDRALHLSAATQDVADVNLRNIEARAGKLVGFNAAGNAALYGLTQGSIVGPQGAISGVRVELSAPAIFTRNTNLSWSHNTVVVTFIWTLDGVQTQSRELTITVNEGTAAFNNPGLSEPSSVFTTTLAAGGQLLRITSEYGGVREYVQLAIVTMPEDAYPSVNFTPTWGTGQFTTPPSGAITYTLRSGVVTLTLAAARVAESASGTMTWDAASLPVAIRPAAARTVHCVLQYNDTVEVQGQATFNPDGSAAFTVHTVTGAVLGTNGAFQTGEDKGLPAHWNVVYAL